MTLQHSMHLPITFCQNSKGHNFKMVNNNGLLTLLITKLISKTTDSTIHVRTAMQNFQISPANDHICCSHLAQSWWRYDRVTIQLRLYGHKASAETFLQSQIRPYFSFLFGQHLCQYLVALHQQPCLAAIQDPHWLVILYCLYCVFPKEALKSLGEL